MLHKFLLHKVVTCQRITSKNLKLSGPIPESAIRPSDDGQQMLYFDSCQLNFIRMANFQINVLLTASVSLGCNGGLMGRNVVYLSPRC